MFIYPAPGPARLVSASTPGTFPCKQMAHVMGGANMNVAERVF